MSREEAKEYLPILKAYIEGKQIQWLNEYGKWIDANSELLTFYSPASNYRIKSKPKYRPFQSQEECWNEMHKHPDFGWVKEISCEMLYLINGISNESIVIMEDINSFKEAMNIYEFKDGTPFGIKEE